MCGVYKEKRAASMFCGILPERSCPPLYRVRFYQDQLYNPHAPEYWTLYGLVLPDWRVFGSPTWSTKERGVPAANALATIKKDRRRFVYSLHRIPVLVHWARGTYEHTERVRCRFFKVLRPRLCRQWLAHVRVLLLKQAEWGSVDVADCVLAQLGAWFATVPHREVRWSDYVPERGRYRVCWW